jgi:protein TonB
MNKPVTACWDDIVFEYRNRDYGAYLLRYVYPKYLSIAALIVIGAFLIGIIGDQILRKEILQRERGVKVINYTELEQPPPIERVAVEAPKAAAKYVAPEITSEEPEKEQDFMTMDQVRGMLDTTPEAMPTGNESPQEAAQIIVVEPPPEPEPVHEPEPPPPAVVKPPEFPGGMDALQKWLGSHLNYPAMAVRMGIEGTVVVEFTVDINGKLSDAKVVQSLHKLCDNEAIRLVKSMPDWTPGDENSVKKTAKVTLPIRFILQ